MNNDQLSSAVLFVIGLAIGLGSIPYKLGALSSPGSGLMPFLVGASICSFSLIGFIHGTLRKRKGEGWVNLLQGPHWKRSFVILASLLAYALLLVPLGFVPCTTLFVAFLFRAVVPHRWPVVIGGGLLAAIASYLIFDVWLKAQLPKGLFGI